MNSSVKRYKKITINAKVYKTGEKITILNQSGALNASERDGRGGH